MHRPVRPFAAVLSCLVLIGWSLAAGAAEKLTDIPIRFERLHAHYRLNADGSAVYSRQWAMRVLKESAVGSAKTASIHYSTSVEKAEVLEAYTRKADGKRVDAAPANFQLEVNSGVGKAAPAFSDQTRLTVVFPEVAVGDTVVLSYRVTQLEPIFPGHFSLRESFSESVAYDDVEVLIDAPTALWTQHETYQLALETREGDGRKRLKWTYRNPEPVRPPERGGIFKPERHPGYAFSTFRSYAEIARAYGERATPKAKPTERVRQLARDIIAGSTDKREQARRLYEWVATNVDYAGNCVGIGAVVPRDLEVVLDNRMGDCKDHATLLQALLAAQGIESVQALINAGQMYELPKVPVVSSVNHVINYLPAFDLFVDATSDSTPFGMLPQGEGGKPVLLVENYRDGARTPVTPHAANQQAIRSRVHVASDSSAAAEIDVSLQGVFAVHSRARFRELNRDDEIDLVKNVIQSVGYSGEGSLEKDDPQALTDRFRYGAKLRIEQFLQLPGPGGLGVFPLFFSEAPIQGAAALALEPDSSDDVPCWGGHSSEDYTIVFPKGVRILAVPKDLTVRSELLDYRATYRRKANTVTVSRQLDDKTPGGVCTPETMKTYKAAAQKVLQDLRGQILYE